MSTYDTEDRIGVIGLGRMGRTIADTVAATGLTVSGWNRSRLTPADLGDCPTITLCDNLPELVSRSEILILSLFDDGAVRAVMEQLLECDVANRIIVDTSTVRPDTLASFRHVAGTKRATLIDAPISGGPEMVRAGTAGMFLGGEAPDVDRFRPVAQRLAGRIRHIGPLGSGAAAKIVNNMVLMGCWETLREAVTLGRKAGLGTETMIDLIFDGPAANPAMKSRREEVLGNSDRVGFPVDGVIKDAEVFLSVAADLGVQVPAVSAALDSFRTVAAAGYGADDLAAVVREVGRD